MAMHDSQRSPDVNWSLAKAKDNLSEVVRRATAEGPQSITVHGEETALVISK